MENIILIGEIQQSFIIIIVTKLYSTAILISHKINSNYARVMASTLAICFALTLGLIGFIMALVPLCCKITHKDSEGIGK